MNPDDFELGEERIYKKKVLFSVICLETLSTTRKNHDIQMSLSTLKLGRIKSYGVKLPACNGHLSKLLSTAMDPYTATGRYGTHCNSDGITLSKEQKYLFYISIDILFQSDLIRLDPRYSKLIRPGLAIRGVSLICGTADRATAEPNKNDSFDRNIYFFRIFNYVSEQLSPLINL